MPGPNVPFPPMEAELVKELPEGDGWQYEPKWDGFRGILENDGGEVALWSRKERPLLRYFPELRELGDLLPPHSALDGEIVIARDGVLDFDSMQMRLHPAESRVQRLSKEIPAEFVAFDVLLWKGKPLHEQPLRKRRTELERVAKGFGLYRDDGGLDYVGSAAVAASRHAQIADRVVPLIDEKSDRRFSEPNRWGTGDLEEQAVEPKLVAEVRYDKVQGNRFRHGTRFLRFREDKEPKDCTWRELRPPRNPNDPTFESLLAA